MSENNKVSDKTLDYMIHDANLQYLAAGFPDLCAHWQDRIDALTELKSLRAENERLRKEIEDAVALAERLKLEAQGHASEARTANATIYEIYQVLSGSSGEPGNWNGAEPARAFVAATKAKLEEAAKVLEPFADAVFNDNGDITVNFGAPDPDDFFRAYRFIANLKGAE